jgi:hypothetical protein
MPKVRIAFPIAALCAAFLTATALAQSATLGLHLSRDWGYGGFNGDIQGNFTIEASGVPNVTRVEFLIDDTKLGEATQAPFRLQFVTDNYPAGRHTLHAIGYLADGSTVPSETINSLFLSSAEASQSTASIIVPILVIVFGGMLVAALVPILLIPKSRRQGMGSPFQYVFGGGFCPKCGQPFRFHIYGIKFGFAKWDRCPNCGKWSMVPHASLDALIEAERAKQASPDEANPSLAEKTTLQKELDDSKYQDL